MVQKKGIRNIHAVITTVHRCVTSLKNTETTERIGTKPMQKHMSGNRQTSSKIKCQVGRTWNYSMTKATATSEKAKLMSENSIF